MIRPVITLLMGIVTLSVAAQNMSVKSFQLLERDLTAQVTDPVIDQNGDKAALIKVVTTHTGFEFDGGMLGIVKTVQKTAEIWVYVPHKAKALTIKHPQLGIIRNYAYPIPIEMARTYELVLVTGQIETIVKPMEVETQWLVISSDPGESDVYINDQPAGKTPYQNELPVGKYTYRVSKELYLPEAGVVEISVAGGRKTLNLKLKPNYGTLQVSSLPENGAKVKLNGIDLGKTTPCTLEMIPTGEHTLTLTHEWYETANTRITLTAVQTLPVKVEMNPTFAEVTVSSEPAADIFINNERKGIGTWKGRLRPAVYTFEARLDKHNPATEKQTVFVGKPLTVTLKPTPKTGSLKVISTPFDAKITLNGRDYGLTPITVKDLLIGDYTFTLTKPGYGTVTKTITITDGKTTEVNETLPSGMEVTITSTPAGAQLWVNGNSMGTTPVTTTLAFGTHSVKLVNGKRVVEENITVTQGGKTRWEYNVSDFVCFTETAAGINMEMAFVKGGTFEMGDTFGDGDNDEKPVHRVTVSDFYMGKYEVTQAQWRAIMGNNPSFFKNCDNCPVENVSWDDIQEFLRKLNQQTGKRYRLPTEAEWEYASKGGVKTHGRASHKYAGNNNIDEVAWYLDNSGGKTHPVGGKKPNELGLYDMTGNVFEWCSDRWHDNYQGAPTDGSSWESGSSSFRVLRGGSWFVNALGCRSADRGLSSPDFCCLFIGFRVVLSPDSSGSR